MHGSRGKRRQRNVFNLWRNLHWCWLWSWVQHLALQWTLSTEPCNKKCPSSRFSLSCSLKCEEEQQRTDHLCEDKCLDLNTPCKGICPNRDTYNCNGVCQNLEIACGIHCPEYRYLNCEKSCSYSNTYRCNNICQNNSKPCDGKCLYGEPNCHGECTNFPTATYICDGQCQSVSQPCQGICQPGVNFINIKRTNFLYERSFWQLFLVTCS